MYDWLATLGLVFGGCCSNAVSLEQLTSDYPSAGSLITFFQFSIISLYGLPKHIIWTSYGPRLAPTRIPISRYLIQVALFYIISLLNNAAFAYQIPMSVHIIFRSGGLVVSMILGWSVARKKYNIHQVLSVLLVTLGVVCTTLSASNSSSNDSNMGLNTYLTGICILSLALILSGFLGLVQDHTYSQYSGASAWKESMFYLHFLALPMFFLLRNDLATQFHLIHAGPKISSILIPTAYPALLLNTLTQLVCVSGVNRLTTRVNSLTVTLVLVVRKAVSLVLSVAMRQTTNNVDMRLLWAGAAMVLLGTIWYSLGGKKPKPKKE
ncbi:UAA transporter [Desarmillaria tabescens]|uniref:UAA transporter n=1 Tax=Armillaria tabescens TaxID=1929756 RepID=A0AA39K066_ARMTA|nr:UAA transporter [Desarmillaria tabescens]KAK0452054.1 UAA transporter [Desarmillaria tabescens]